jgi:hypothetical protein
MGGTPRWLRPALAAMLRAKGKRQLADIVAAAGPRSADQYWQLIYQANSYVRAFLSRRLTREHEAPEQAAIEISRSRPRGVGS